MERVTIPSVFAAAAERFRERIAFRYYDDRWNTLTYGDVLSLTEHIASFFPKYGFKKGERAAIIAENRPEWCASYLAVVMSGGIAVPMDMQLGAEEIRNLLLDSEAGIVFYTAKTEHAVSRALRGLSSAGINLDTIGSPSPQHETRSVTEEISPDDCASIIYTSGTTGSPKGVMLTHRNFCSDADAVMSAGILHQDDNVLAVLPLHHTYPFMCAFLVPLFRGGSVTFGPGLKAAEIISAIKDNGVTVVLGVPKLFEMIRNGISGKIRERSGLLLKAVTLCGAIRRKTGLNAGKVLFRSVHVNFPLVKFFASGGARLDPAVMNDLEALGFTVIEGYGLTETSPVITFNPIVKRKPGSAGIPLPGVEIGMSEDGEIMVKGPMVMKGYYKNPAATNVVFRDGWFLTGDLGYKDAEGYLYITGRRKEVIVLSSGKNVYPEDVEKAYAAASPLIKEMCVIAHEDNGGVDSVQAVIVPDLDYARRASVGHIREALDDSIRRVSSALPGYMRIRGYVLYPEPLPRTPLGKLRRFMVADAAKRGQPDRKEAKEDPLLKEDETGRKVAESIRALMAKDVPFHSHDSLELDLGFDSLKKIELISSLEEMFSLRLPDTFIAKIHTVEEVVAHVKEFLRGGEAAEGGPAPLSWKEILEKGSEGGEAVHVGSTYTSIERAAVFCILHLLKLIFRVVFRLRVEGGENIPEHGPFVITPNHVSFLDGFIIASAVPFRTFEHLYLLGLRKYFTGGIKSWLARLSHVIPIDSEVYLNRALQVSASVLRSNGALCIFPEGSRSFDGKVMPFKKGIGVLAVEMGIPVIPTYIHGAFSALPRGTILIRPAKVKVSFGKPVTPYPGEAGREDKDGDVYQRFADRVREKVIQLSNE